MTGAAVHRRTLRNPAEVRGAGLFTAAPATVRIFPANPGAGFAFRRVDLPGAPLIPATAAHLAPSPTGRNTTLAVPGPPTASVATVEHILSALAGLGVTDALIEIDGPEVPIADGSAAPFTDAIAAVGVTDLGPTIKPIVITAPIRIADSSGGPGVISAEPSSSAEYIYELDYGPGAPIPAQRAVYATASGDYAAAVAPARTFCLETEARAMRAAGLFTHLSPRDMLVIGPSGPIDNHYRFPDEPACHKLLDLIGDLALAGRPIQGRVTASRTGHAANHAMARAIVAATA